MSEENRTEIECPACGEDGLIHSVPAWWWPYENEYRCESCGWEGYGPDPANAPEDPELTLISRVMDKTRRWVRDRITG